MRFSHMDAITSFASWATIMGTMIGGFYLLDAKIERQGARTDKLYEMFIDLVKETRK